MTPVAVFLQPILNFMATSKVTFPFDGAATVQFLKLERRKRIDVGLVAFFSRPSREWQRGACILPEFPAR